MFPFATTVFFCLWLSLFPVSTLSQELPQPEQEPVVDGGGGDTVGGGGGGGFLNTTEVFPVDTDSSNTDVTFVDENGNSTAVVVNDDNTTIAVNTTEPTTTEGPDAGTVTSINNTEPIASPGNETIMSDGNDNTIDNNTEEDSVPDGELSAPTAAPLVPISVTGTVSLELLSTPRLLSGDTLTTFLETTEAFLGLTLLEDSSNGTSSLSSDMILLADPGLSVEVTRQSRSLLRLRRRHLQAQRQDQQQQQLDDGISRPLYLTLEVTGKSFMSIQATDLDQLLQRIFIEQETAYVEALRGSPTDDDIFVPSLTQVNVLLESTFGGGGRDKVPTDPPVLSPTSQENGSRPVVSSSNGTNDNNTSGIGALSQTAIIGIAVGGAGLLLLMVGCMFYFYGPPSCCTRNSHKELDPEVPAGSTGGSRKSKNMSPQKNSAWMLNSRKEHPPEDGSLADQNLLQTASSSNRFGAESESASDMTSDQDMESQAMYSYNPRGDSGSVYTFNNTTTMVGGNQSVFGNDNMSYAYSLEPGIEASVIGGVHMQGDMTYDNASLGPSMYGMDDESHRSRIPIREIPHISVPATVGNAASLSSRRQQSTGSSSHHSRSNHDEYGATQIEMTPSDLKLTESELAMLPSNLRSGDDNDDNNTSFTDTRNFVTRTVPAPSGKLGIVIDTTVDGPVVHKVNDGSRLMGIIFPGDIITSIDDVDTRAMSASAITALMVKTAGQKRILTVYGPPIDP